MRKRTGRLSGGVAALAAEVIRVLAGCAPVAVMDCPISRAQDIDHAVLVADIPAQPLASALAAFATQTGLQLVYVSEIVDRQRSRVARAGMRAEEALPTILRGTGLKFEYLTSRSIRILNAPPTPDSSSDPLESLFDDIIVTANRRDETLQNVPITIQVLTGATLTSMNATTFDDFISHFPGVTAHGVGPAQNNIFVRGLGTSDFPNQNSGTNGIFPNVAIYLDEQSAQLSGRNLDIYAVDLDRIEVLEGPQGTLFGAGAEAGVIRYITNKPKLDVLEGATDARYAVTAHGAPSTSADAVINLPLIENTLAVRGVIYNDRRGGYIDNIPATFTRSASDASIRYAKYLVDGVPEVPPNSAVINNSTLVGSDINPVTYQGIRVEILYQSDNGWNALLAQSYQSMEADGVFTETALDSQGTPLPPLTTQLFNPSYDKDRFENTALTVNGRLGSLALLYTGAFSVRNVNQVQDYTNYAHGGRYADYYQCVNPGPTARTATCFSPSSTWRNLERNTHLSQEIRISTSAESRIRGVGGLFYEDYKIQDEDDWFYLSALPYFSPIAPPTGYYLLDGRVLSGPEAYGTNAIFVPGPVTSNNPDVRPPNDAFFNDSTHGYQQNAAFASVDWELLPGSLVLTSGTRYFLTRSSEVGSEVGSYGCSLAYAPVPDPCVNRDSNDLNALGLRRNYSGFRSRVGLEWTPRHGAMLYTTWSQGFRAGGFNRGFETPSNSPFAVGSATWQAQASQHGGWTLPLAYAPDNVVNTEFGWRSSWLAGRLHFNGTLYQEDWKNAQVSAESIEFSGSDGVVNGGTYRVRGVETSTGLQGMGGFSVDANAAWSRGRLVTPGVFYWADGTPIDFNTLRNANSSTVVNFAGAPGSPLAGAPAFQGNLRARYEFDVASARASFQIGAVHQTHSLSNTTNASINGQGIAAVYNLPGFTTLDGALGFTKSGWTVQAYGENLTDEHAQLFANYFNFVKAITVNRPRTIGLRLSYKFIVRE